MEKITILYHALIVASGVLMYLMTKIPYYIGFYSIDIEKSLNLRGYHKTSSGYGIISRAMVCDKCLSFWSGLLAGLFLYKSWECLILAVLSVVMIKVLKNITKQDFL